MSKARNIQVYVQALSQLAPLSKSDFPDIQHYLAYKKQQIYIQRNHYLTEFTQQSVRHTDIAVSEFGKPFLKYRSDISFNHSHSQQHYALAMSHHLQGKDKQKLLYSKYSYFSIYPLIRNIYLQLRKNLYLHKK